MKSVLKRLQAKTSATDVIFWGGYLKSDLANVWLPGLLRSATMNGRLQPLIKGFGQPLLRKAPPSKCPLRSLLNKRLKIAVL
jgi:hypothetical protein